MHVVSIETLVALVAWLTYMFLHAQQSIYTSLNGLKAICNLYVVHYRSMYSIMMHIQPAL